MNDFRHRSPSKRVVLTVVLLVCVLLAIHVGIIVRFVPLHPAISSIVTLCLIKPIISATFVGNNKRLFVLCSEAPVAARPYEADGPPAYSEVGSQ